MNADDLPLQVLQPWFVRVTTDAESVRAGVEREADIVALNELERILRPGRTESALERLGIYHHSYFSRLTECLADDYPAVRFALGAHVFDTVSREYIDRFPSHEPNLNGFGRNFARFLEEHQHGLWQFEAELAHLEWGIVEVLHARAPERILPAAFEGIAPDALAGVRFEASRAVRVFAFEYPVNAFFQAFVRDQRPIRPAPVATNVVVVRTAYEIWRLELDPVAAKVLRQLIGGARLGAALEGIDARPDQVQSWFQDWTTHGVFERVVTAG